MSSAPARQSRRDDRCQSNGRSVTMSHPVRESVAKTDEHAVEHLGIISHSDHDERRATTPGRRNAQTGSGNDAIDLPAVTLVIPGRNAGSVVRQCLDSVVPLLQRGELTEIIFVDDASTDATPQIAAEYPVTLLRGPGAGPGAARNIGWRAAATPLIWFIDADCVAEPDALQLLRGHLTTDRVAAAGGSYSNMRPDSLLANLIHEEIVERHRRMTHTVNFLATFNVLYRRSLLQDLGGFDEQFRLAQDVELAFRVLARGYQLHFDRESRVGHFHATRLGTYLRTQARQGYYRVFLYRKHPQRVGGDNYSGMVDHIQPPLAILFGICVLMVAWRPVDWTFWSALVTGMAFLSTALPMTVRLVGRTRQLRFLAFAPFCWLRAVARAAGLVAGLIRSITIPETQQCEI